MKKETYNENITLFLKTHCFTQLAQRFRNACGAVTFALLTQDIIFKNVNLWDPILYPFIIN